MPASGFLSVLQLSLLWTEEYLGGTDPSVQLEYYCLIFLAVVMIKPRT